MQRHLHPVISEWCGVKLYVLNTYEGSKTVSASNSVFGQKI